MLGREGLHLRAAFFRLIRSFFHQHGFLEVDTPLRQPIYIPESNIVPLESEKEYLQTSPELCMKRLLAAGNSKIFQICPCFRKEERGRLHLEEFKMLEWYRTGVDYYRLMHDCEALFHFLLLNLMEWQETSGLTGISFFSGIDLGTQWERLTVAEAFTRYSPIDLDQALMDSSFEEILVENIEPHLGFNSPVFLYDYPVELGSLARTGIDNPKVVERFELYIKGIELANGFSELTDVEEQRRRFLDEITTIKAQTGRKAIMPERFLEDLERLDTAAGIAMGLDRLFMIGLNSERIIDVVTFSPDDFL